MMIIMQRLQDEVTQLQLHHDGAVAALSEVQDELQQMQSEFKRVTAAAESSRQECDALRAKMAESDKHLAQQKEAAAAAFTAASTAAAARSANAESAISEAIARVLQLEQDVAEAQRRLQQAEADAQAQKSLTTSANEERVNLQQHIDQLHAELSIARSDDTSQMKEAKQRSTDLR